jgi:hypothetical protein
MTFVMMVRVFGMGAAFIIACVLGHVMRKCKIELKKSQGHKS